MNLEEIEEAVVDMPIVSGVCPTGGGLVREDILWLIAEVKQLREEIERLQKLAGDFLGTDPEMQNTACIEVAITHAKWLRKENYRLREQGELFLTQIKDVRAEIEIERLKADWDGFIHGGL